MSLDGGSEGPGGRMTEVLGLHTLVKVSEAAGVTLGGHCLVQGKVTHGDVALGVQIFWGGR